MRQKGSSYPRVRATGCKDVLIRIILLSRSQHLQITYNPNVILLIFKYLLCPQKRWKKKGLIWSFIRKLDSQLLGSANCSAEGERLMRDGDSFREVGTLTMWTPVLPWLLIGESPLLLSQLPSKLLAGCGTERSRSRSRAIGRGSTCWEKVTVMVTCNAHNWIKLN